MFEYIVDGIFYIDIIDFDFRIICLLKNCNGSIDIVGLFRMIEKGMISFDDFSKIFIFSFMEFILGFVIICNCEGNCNFMLEI